LLRSDEDDLPIYATEMVANLALEGKLDAKKLMATYYYYPVILPRFRPSAGTGYCFNAAPTTPRKSQTEFMVLASRSDGSCLEQAAVAGAEIPLERWFSKHFHLQ